MDGICAVLLENLFSCDLRSFVAKPILSRFTHFLCGEKLSPKFCPWRKMTNIMYGETKFINRATCLTRMTRDMGSWAVPSRLAPTVLIKTGEIYATFEHFCFIDYCWRRSKNYQRSSGTNIE